MKELKTEQFVEESMEGLEEVTTEVAKTGTFGKIVKGAVIATLAAGVVVGIVKGTRKLKQHLANKKANKDVIDATSDNDCEN